MKQTKILATASLLVAAGCVSVEPELPTITTVTLSKAELKDKIKARGQLRPLVSHSGRRMSSSTTAS